jgi:hypothetical protein
MDESYPFKECKKCQVLDDCPCPDVTDDLLSTPFPPDCCPRPFEIIKATLKKHKINHELLRKN